jgi:hypothetical protein
MKRGTNDADGLGKSLLPGHSERNYRVFQQTVKPAGFDGFTARLKARPFKEDVKNRATQSLKPAMDLLFHVFVFPQPVRVMALLKAS